MTILLIDDEETGTAIRAKVLLAHHDEVLLAFCGRDGLRQFAHRQVDLVILDFYLPDLNGDQVLVALKRLKPEIPVVLLAGLLGITEEKTPEADCTIVKDQGPAPLLAAIKHLLPERV